MSIKSTFLSLFKDDVYDVDTSGIEDAYNNAIADIEGGRAKASQILSNVNTNMKTAEQLYKEGRSVAGQAARDKAGIAKSQAKAASTMAGASKLFSAIQGAQAANEAAVQGYDDTATQAASMAAEQESKQKNMEMNRAGQLAGIETSSATAKANAGLTTAKNKADIEASNKANQRASDDSRRQTATNLATAMMQMASS